MTKKYSLIYKFLTSLLCLLMFWQVLFTPLALAQKDAGQDDYGTWLQTVYSRENGLPVGRANAVASTRNGLLWIGTYAGLYRYNGSKFQLMTEYDGVKSVQCLFVDEDDRLWIGTNDNGLFIYKDGELLGSLSKENGLPSDAIRSIIKAADGMYYIGTSDSMVTARFVEKPEVIEILNDVQYIENTSADDKGNIAAVSPYGVLYLIKNGKIIDKRVTSTSDRFTSCLFDKAGRVIYAGTSMGYVYRYTINQQKLEQLDRFECEGMQKINSLVRLNENTIFVCADNGIGYFDEANRFYRLETGKFNNNVQSASMDYQGNLWFTSTRMGLLRLCRTSFTNLFTQYGIEQGVVNSIVRYNGLLYVATDRGLRIIDENNRTVVHNNLEQALEGLRIRQIIKDKNNHLWLAAYIGGLIEYDGTNIKFYSQENPQIGNRFRTVLELSTGEVVATSEHGITFVREGKVEKLIGEADGLINQINLCLLELKDGTLLIGSDGSGIMKLKDDKIEVIGKKQGLASEVILRMVRDAYGDGIFVITGSAICYMEADGSIRVLDNFPYSNNYNLLQQDESVFITSSAGVYAVMRKELLSNNKNMKYVLLDTKAGLNGSLVANSWPLHEYDTHKVYLTTNAGAEVFDLAAFDARPHNFKIGLFSVNVDGKKIVLDKGENLFFDTNVRRLEIVPEVINFTTDDPLISCYLEGVDKDPIIMPQSEISPIVYTNLPSGKYKLHLSLVDSESGVTISQKEYYVEKDMELKDSLWFNVALAIFGMLAITWIGAFLGKRWYTEKLAEKEAALEETWLRSITDDLTGLRNRAAMRIEFPKYIGSPLSVVMMDIDYFKKFNDTYGHEMGDKVLQSFSRVLATHYVGSNVAFRYGGDEFLIWDTSGNVAEVEQRLQEVVREINNIRIEGCDEELNACYGVASGKPNSLEELRNLQLEADKNLYEAKNKRKSLR